MSENSAERPHIFSVTTDEFIRFLEAKTLDNPCPACQHGTWSVLGSTGTGYAVRSSVAVFDGAKPSKVNLLMLHCDNCGFVRHHMAKLVREWIDSPQQEELDFEEGSDE